MTDQLSFIRLVLEGPLSAKQNRSWTLSSLQCILSYVAGTFFRLISRRCKFHCLHRKLWLFLLFLVQVERNQFMWLLISFLLTKIWPSLEIIRAPENLKVEFFVLNQVIKVQVKLWQIKIDCLLSYQSNLRKYDTWFWRKRFLIHESLISGLKILFEEFLTLLVDFWSQYNYHSSMCKFDLLKFL